VLADSLTTKERKKGRKKERINIYQCCHGHHHLQQMLLSSSVIFLDIHGYLQTATNGLHVPLHN
jgi:hypothetical protein